MSALVLFAQGGHWLVSLLYVAPVVVLVAALLVTRHRDDELGEDEMWEDGDDFGGIDDGDDLSQR